ncbi:MAG: metallophosphoesterase [Gemmataceae bacterium]
MKTLLTGVMALTVLAGAVALSRTGVPGGLSVASERRNPWTGLKLNNDPESFQFAIVSDRTGGHRDKIFSRAVARLNLLQPEFVVSVGDLIEGGRKPKPKLEAEWQEFDGYVNQLTMPFFYVPGNHDVGVKDSDALWRERYGRRWFHFVYKGVLFLCLNSDDGSGGNLGNEQIAYAKQALADNKDVRNTLVYIHKPVWTGDIKKNGWGDVEAALQDGGRPYTVFCGHVHRYRKFVRQGRNYYQLATTGGGSKVRGIPYGEFDHVVWVTVKKDGPVFANLMLDSILPDDLKVPESEEKGVPTRAGKTHPVRGVVYHAGVPLAGAYVTFRGAGVIRGGADAVTDGDGSFTPSTYKAFDGLPEGKYSVAVTLRRPMTLPDGRSGPNLLPEKFADGRTSGVTVEVKPGANELKIDLE